MIKIAQNEISWENLDVQHEAKKILTDSSINWKKVVGCDLLIGTTSKVWLRWLQNLPVTYVRKAWYLKFLIEVQMTYSIIAEKIVQLLKRQKLWNDLDWRNIKKAPII